MPTDDEDEERRRRGIEALRAAAQSPNVTADERVFLLDVATGIGEEESTQFFDRLRVRRILAKVLFG